MDEQAITLKQVESSLGWQVFILRGYVSQLNVDTRLLYCSVQEESRIDEEKKEGILQDIQENLRELQERIDFFPTIELSPKFSEINQQNTEMNHEMVTLRQIRDWLGAIAHDVQSPLSNLAVCIALIQEGMEFSSAEEREKYLWDMTILAQKVWDHIEMIDDTERFTNFIKKQS